MRYVVQLMRGVEYCHAHGVVHRDIKPANVLYDGRRWRLCDFGFAIKCGERRLKKMVGTPAYIAPELVTRSAYTGPSVDMWAFGCMVDELMHGRPCFVAPTMDDLDLRIKNGFNARGQLSMAVWVAQPESLQENEVGVVLEADEDDE